MKSLGDQFISDDTAAGAHIHLCPLQLNKVFFRCAKASLAPNSNEYCTTSLEKSRFGQLGPLFFGRQKRRLARMTENKV